MGSLDVVQVLQYNMTYLVKLNAINNNSDSNPKLGGT